MGPSTVASLPAVTTILVCCVITTQVGRYYCTQLELLPIPIGIGATSNTLGTTRFRACLPLITGSIARIVGIFRKEDKSSDLIPLARMPSAPGLSTTK
ncbi:hypothetical protein PSACC_00692 [Paramicrosporidium saccamoebae]|uniref:Secreted protein n=1 Tax=Paramicrosporidium saccamoebae TaxID=1246581 RepID=A0A2H9TP03_9FUNG|nr:hypothetical protein PSACC_00692 [Paramicrosporidium saccamoebae]